MYEFLLKVKVRVCVCVCVLGGGGGVGSSALWRGSPSKKNKKSSVGG